MKKKDSWEKEFDKKYSDLTFTPKSQYEAFYQVADELKSFIHSLLKQERQRVLEGIEKKVKLLKESYSGGLERFEEENGIDLEELVYAYNQAIKEVVQLIQTLKEEK